MLFTFKARNIRMENTGAYYHRINRGVGLIAGEDVRVETEDGFDMSWEKWTRDPQKGRLESCKRNTAKSLREKQ